MEKIPLTELGSAAKRALAAVSPHADRATLITLSGDLGAGKTTFVQALARGLGITETLQSPTYVLMKKYALKDQVFDTLVHIDAYRLDHKNEFETLDPSSFISSPRTLVALEWPERVEGALPEADLELKFLSDGAGEGERYISIDSE